MIQQTHSLRLTCDGHGCRNFVEFQARNTSQCIRAARQARWIVVLNKGEAICPKCQRG